MSMSPFRLLIYAIAALTILFLFFNYFLIYFFPSSVTAEKIHEFLDIAETQDGQYISKQIAFSQNETLAAKAFDTSARSVSFRCLSGTECCTVSEPTQSCKVAVSPRNISFLKIGTVKMNFRCGLEHNIFDCKVFIGGEPAQLTFSNLEIPKKIDLSQGTPIITAEVENTGQLPAKNVLLTIRVYSLSDIGEKTLHTSPVDDIKAELNAGEKHTFTVPLPTQFAGDYEVQLTLSGEEAGTDRTEETISVTGTSLSSDCTPTTPDAPYLSGTECITHYNCTDCDFSAECKIVWERQGQQGLEFKDPKYAVLITMAQDGSCE